MSHPVSHTKFTSWVLEVSLTFVSGSRLVTFSALKHSVLSSVSFKIKNMLYKYNTPASQWRRWSKKLNHHLYHGCVEQITGLVGANMIKKAMMWAIGLFLL